MKDEFRNEGIVAEHMLCDGARFSMPHLDDNTYFLLRNWIEETLRKEGWSDAEISRDVRTSVIGAGKGGRFRLLDTWWVNGKAAAVIAKKDQRFAKSVTELHVKCFWVERKPGDHERFIDAMWSSKFPVTMAGFRGKPNAKSRRTAGHKGARIGNPKSDNHKVIYKGADEKTGTEVHLKGRQLGRIKETAHERYVSERRRETGRTLWDVTVEECAYHAAHSLLKSLREMGINITDYFSGVSSVSWSRPLHGDDVECLDEQQEADYVRTATNRLQRQLSIFETEGNGD